jgi:hypothetical protein
VAIRFFLPSVLVPALLGVSAAFGAAGAVPANIEFNRDVRPILSNQCFKCHGFDAKERKADRRIDTAEGAYAEIDKVRAIVPGNLEASDTWHRITSTDADEQMPPPKSGKHLTDRDKEVLKRWIEQGAKYEAHWAYIVPKKPQVAAGENAIDTLVARRVKEAGLTAAPEADRVTLLRRVYFDLIGLPPTREDTDVFLQDTAPDAYGRLVERLLANPHYGERMAIPWLDVVRFADTAGYHSDNGRNVWPYRDWVIRAFNANMPFDEFTKEQLAGDLLPNSTRQQQVGSAFNRLLLTTEEGGAQAKDYESRMVTDRVRAVGTVWLGATIGCAQCHDHKFDPITSRDFYALGAFFADLKEPIIGRREPGLDLGTPEQEKALAALNAKVAAAEQELAKPAPGLEAEAMAWVAEYRGGKKLAGAKLPKDFLEAAALPSAFYTLPQRALVVKEYRNVAPRLAKERAALQAATAERTKLDATIPKCIVSVHMEPPRTVRILPRGNWQDESGEVMKPALPRFLPNAPEPTEKPLTRLDLAEWLVAKRNPLTARVFVNRLWKQFFGAGLSKVLDDLGNQGEPPANPALLDYLATDFMDSGWNMKHLVRLIVTSKTYRQSSVATKAQLAQDPYNRELARQGRWRLDAELVRDNALATAGLLVPKIGGPSVNPYQPEGYWENLNFPVRTWPTSTGPDQYRRGLYTWWQRSYAHPSMLAFDAPTREECAAERVRSNIPQQALVLLNDPTYVEAARAFAARILQECAETTPAARLTWAYQQALQRTPRAEEQSTLEALLKKQLEEYKKTPDTAAELLKIGQSPAPANLNAAELAAWTNIARAIFNLHETITRS